MLLELLPSFTARGWKPYVAVPNENGTLPEKARELGYGTGSFQFGRYSKIQKTSGEIFPFVRDSILLTKDLLRWIRTLAIDLVYVNGPRVLPAASWAARRSGLPLLFHCHSRLHQRSAVRVAASSLRFSRAEVVACSRYAAEPLLSSLRAEYVHVIYNGVAGIARNATGERPPLRRIGVVGRIEEEKGQLEFVHAVRILSRTHPELRFSVIGKPLFADGAYFDLVWKASEGLPIDFKGWVNTPAEIFDSLDLIVVPSTSLDATPRIVMEALAAGIPIVANAVGGIPEILKNLETGILVHQRTPEALAEGISLVLRMDHERIGHIVDKGRRVWQEKHSPEAYGDTICRVISRMVKAA